ncbi:NAD(P)H-hydrate dehydratase [Anaerosporobacter faecicola]|uniref:NAD(P)H-hydrate dehydratase n=1 Tax=Anaerosporobacter faecicola TaxID=2718714 RepID=UPI0014388493|nr:NAD(P)H-hydrate dehydratase [Anaerosporobacter faecicola]
MKYLVDAAKMKSIDEYTSNTIGIPSLVLMEKAAMAIVEIMKEMITPTDRILAVCGTGNNGGDGIAAVRLLMQQGYQADVYLLGEEEHATEQTKQQLHILRNLGGNVYEDVQIEGYSVIIDAIFGVGLSRPITGRYEQVIRMINEHRNTVYAVDIPSGIHADQGKIMNVAVKADYTVTFGVNKIGLVLYPGKEYAGNTVVADIGFPTKAIESVKPNIFTYEREDIKRLPCRKNYSNKGTFGKVLIIAGSRNMSGACYLSAKAACRSGAGLVKVMTVEDNRSIMQSLLPEAILATYDPADLKNKLEVDRIVKEVKWASAIVVGPGIGISAAADHLLDIVLNYATVPVVIDADALSLLAGKTQYILKDSEKECFSDIDLPENVIITPHLKEMARLLDCSVTDIRENLLTIARNAVKGKRFVLALKDARTIVSDGSRCYINQSGNNGMATAGAGDVLTGIIVALLAQGMDRYEAAVLGVYIHGLAGDEAVRSKSTYSLIASDIIEALPLVLHE